MCDRRKLEVDTYPGFLVSINIKRTNRTLQISRGAVTARKFWNELELTRSETRYSKYCLP